MPHPRSLPRGLVVVIAVIAIVVAACGSDVDPEPEAGAGGDTPSTSPSEPASGDELAADAGLADAAPAVLAGGVTTGQVEIDGVVIDYVTATPDDFEPGTMAPVLLAFPPGGQDLGLAQALVEGTYAAEASRLGWVVVSPAAPNGTLYFQGSESLMPGFVDWIESWVQPEGGAPHVAGVSNGGLSSFRYAAENPDRLRSLIAFPGFASTDADLAAMADYRDVPVRMFVGGTDTTWITGAEQTVAAFEELGGDIELRVFPGEGHVMSSTADGKLIFELLESFR